MNMRLAIPFLPQPTKVFLVIVDQEIVTVKLTHRSALIAACELEFTGHHPIIEEHIAT